LSVIGPKVYGVFDGVVVYGVLGAQMVLSVLESRVSGGTVFFCFAYYRPWRRVLAVLVWLAYVIGSLSVLVRGSEPLSF